jgi:hypothetical protein
MVWLEFGGSDRGVSLEEVEESRRITDADSLVVRVLVDSEWVSARNL